MRVLFPFTLLNLVLGEKHDKTYLFLSSVHLKNIFANLFCLKRNNKHWFSASSSSKSGRSKFYCVWGASLNRKPQEPYVLPVSTCLFPKTSPELEMNNNCFWSHIRKGHPKYINNFCLKQNLVICICNPWWLLNILFN